MFKRKLDQTNFTNTTFLLGPRRVGKSTLLRQLFPNALKFDLLDNATYFDFLEKPNLFYDNVKFEIETKPDIKQYPIIVDEIQKIPWLLNSVHKLIEEEKLNFILCGSSARKLVRGGANMLGGRASRIEMYGLSIGEINKDDFDILKFINDGSLPLHYLSNDARTELKSYVQNYIQGEIKAEAIVRNIRSFNRFLELAGMMNGQEVNYSNIARDVAVDTKTVIEYFQILEDTLLGKYLEPYFDKQKRTNISKSPKFYLFDTGIANFLKGIRIEKDEGVEFGKSFEHIILNEIRNYRSYTDKNFKISFLRTTDKYEVDFVLGDADVFIEVKGSKNVDLSELKGLYKLCEVYKPKHKIVVANVSRPQLLDSGIKILPYMEFINLLWNGDLI